MTPLPWFEAPASDAPEGFRAYVVAGRTAYLPDDLSDDKLARVLARMNVEARCCAAEGRDAR